jgi:hypothetical protein
MNFDSTSPIECHAAFRLIPLEMMIKNFDDQLSKQYYELVTDLSESHDMIPHKQDLLKFKEAREAYMFHRKYYCHTEGHCVYSYGRYLWDNFAHIIDLPQSRYRVRLFTILYYNV